VSAARHAEKTTSKGQRTRSNCCEKMSQSDVGGEMCCRCDRTTHISSLFGNQSNPVIQINSNVARRLAGEARRLQLLRAGLGSHDEVRLLEYLFERQGYNPLVRPVANMSDTVRVQLGMALIQLIDVVSMHRPTGTLSAPQTYLLTV